MRRGAAIAAVLAAATQLCGSAAADAADRALVAFTVSVGNGHSEIYLMRSDGSERRRLTGGTVALTRPATSSQGAAWSPDGSRLALVRAPIDDDGPRSIAVLDLASGSAQTVTTGRGDGAPAWSPDGGRIAFVRATASGGGVIFVVAANGGTPVRLTPSRGDGYDSDPAWSPDGSAIAFRRVTYHRRTIDQDVFVMNADGSGARRVAVGGGSPAWSPDGSRIAFVSDRDRNGERCFHDCIVNNELYVMNADGSGQQRLTETDGDEESPAWSADGKTIAFDSDRNSPEGSSGGGREVYSIGADGTCMTWLTNGGAHSEDPTWQPGTARATDPGPGCGATVRAPTQDVDVDALRSFDRHPLYWLGPAFGNALLADLVGTGPLYTDCAAYEASDCPQRIQVQNASICKRHPFSYGSGRGGGESDAPLSDITLAHHRFAYRGAIAAGYPSADGWDIYTGATTVTVFGVGDRPRDIKPVIRALRPVVSDAPAALPRPAFSRSFWSRLATFERVHRRLRNIAATGRELGVTPRAVRDKLALARLLRAHGIRRRATCR